MITDSDAWFVRLPDGRVLRAANTSALRGHINAGRIPHGSWVKRFPEEEWVSLKWSRDFSDLIPLEKTSSKAKAQPAKTEAGTPANNNRNAGGVSSRVEPMQVHTVGVRALVDELLSAMDSTMMAPKLFLAFTAGLLATAILTLTVNIQETMEWPKPWLPWTFLSVALLLLSSVYNTLMTQMTYVELCTLRPANWAEARLGVAGFSWRLLLAYFFSAGGALGTILLLRMLPGWLSSVPDYLWWGAMVKQGSAIVTLMLESLLWPLLGFSLLLGPILIIEDCSVFRALVQWWSLIRRHLGRIILYEGLALALGALFTLPFALPLILTAIGRICPEDSLLTPTGASLCILTGLAATPLIAYLSVANVFIYLNLRYGVNDV